MFTDAGAHFMELSLYNTTGHSLVRVQTVETNELTHISVITRV